MPLTSLPVWEMLLSALAGGGGTKLVDFVATRGRSKAYTMGAVDHAVSTAMGLVTDRLERVEGQHAECERKLGEVRDDLSDARAEIARLMSGPVAPFGQRAPRDE